MPELIFIPEQNRYIYLIDGALSDKEADALRQQLAKQLQAHVAVISPASKFTVAHSSIPKPRHTCSVSSGPFGSRGYDAEGHILWWLSSDGSYTEYGASNA